MRRRGRPSLVGTMARTAVISGTATATVKAVSGNPNRGAQAHAAAAAPPPAASPAPEPGFSSDTVAKLQQLGELRASRVLTDEEFAQAKAKLLG